MGNKFREKTVEEGLVEPVEQDAAGSAASGQQQEPEIDTGRQPSETPAAKGTARGIGKVLGGDVLGDKLVLRQIPLLLLCLVYLLLIVGNRYRIESLSREKQATEDRINFLREQRIQMQKQYQQSVKISQIAEDLDGTGVGITAGPPYEI